MYLRAICSKVKLRRKFEKKKDCYNQYRRHLWLVLTKFKAMYFMKTKLIFNFINCERQKCGCVLFLRAFKQMCPKYFSHIDRVGLFCLGFWTHLNFFLLFYSLLIPLLLSTSSSPFKSSLASNSVTSKVSSFFVTPSLSSRVSSSAKNYWKTSDYLSLNPVLQA